MLSANEKVFERLGITAWHDAGYTGSRVKAITYERMIVPDEYADSIELLWPGRDALSINSENGYHALCTSLAFLQVCPDAHIYQVCDDNEKSSDGVYSGFLTDTLIPWILEEEPPIGFRSKDSSQSGFDDVYADTLSFLSLFNAAGNSSDEDYARRIDDECWFGVGAVNYNFNTTNGDFTARANSSEDDDVDFCGVSGVFVTDSGTRITDTSGATPFLAGMCGLVQDFMIDKIGRPLSHDEMYEFAVAHCEDIYDEGDDDKTGYGVFILPPPESIDLSKYISGEGNEDVNAPVSYLQWDSQWKSVAYTSTDNSSQTIGSSGCGPTCAAMVIATLKDESVTPVETCEWAVENGYRTANQGTSFSYFVPMLAKYEIAATYTYDVAEAETALRSGKMVIGRATSGLWTSSGHYILGYYTDGETILVNDPNSVSSAKTEADLSNWSNEVSPFWIIEEDWSYLDDDETDETDESEDEDDVVRYEKLSDIPEKSDFRAIIDDLMTAGIVNGDGSDTDGNDDVIDLSHDMVRMFIFMYRGDLFDEELEAAGIDPDQYK